MLFNPEWKPPVTPVELKPEQKLLLRAVEILEDKGWIQGIVESPNGYCMIGALDAASDELGSEGWGNVINGLESIVGSIAFWNDSPGRTKEEVIDTLRKVAQ